MDKDEISEEIRKVLIKNLTVALSEFDDYIYLEKYKEAALKKGFYPTSEDFEVQSNILTNYFQLAKKKIIDFGSKAKPCLTELCEEADPIIREWAKEILKNL